MSELTTITIAELEAVTEAPDSSYIPIDNGEATNKITVGNFNASSTATATSQALKSEGYAVGKQNGVAVESGSPYYHNNAEYYADQANTTKTTVEGYVELAQAAQTTATQKAAQASSSASTAETYAGATQVASNHVLEYKAEAAASAASAYSYKNEASSSAASAAASAADALSYKTDVVSAKEDAEAAADRAAAVAVKTPYIGDNGNWYIWDEDEEDFVDSEEPSKGDKGDTGDTGATGAQGPTGPSGADGVSPGVTITPISGGTQVTITDATHPSGQSFNVLNGTGSGDMLASTYDSDSAVASAGGIASYVTGQTNGKADIVSGATNGNLAALNSSGNLTDSGKKASDFALQSELTDEVETRAALGAHNLLEVTATTTTDHGVTFTVNSDKSVSVGTGSGSATANTIFVLNTFALKAGNYKLSIGDNVGPYTVNINAQNGTTFVKNLVSIDGSQSVREKDFTVDYDGYDGITVLIYVTNGTSISSAKIVYPMIRLATDSDTTYRPYAPTNAQLLSYKDNGVLGAKNIFDVKNLFVTTNTGGLTVSIDDDGVISLTGGTTSSGGYFMQAYNFKNVKIPFEANKKYIFSIGTKQSGLWLGVFYKRSGDSEWRTLHNDSNVSECEFTFPSGVVDFWVRIGIDSGVTYSTDKFYPMIRLASDSDPTYQPYAMTNQELTDKLSARLVIDNQSYTSVAAETFEYTGLSFVLDKPALVQVYLKYQTSNPKGVAVSVSSSNLSESQAVIEKSAEGGLTLTTYLSAGTKYVWVKFASANKSNPIDVRVLMTF